MEIALYCTIVILVMGGLIGSFLSREKIKQLERQLAKHKEEFSALEKERYALESSVQVLGKEKEYAELQTQRVEEAYKERLQQTLDQHREQLIQTKELFRQQMEQQALLIREQMSTTSEKILKERSEQLTSRNHEQLSAILNPLNEHIKQMKEAVEKSDKEHSITMERLDATIKTSIEQSKEVGERADKLAQALTGENKTQGNFGELKLLQLLEGMGLEEGIQFDIQTAMRDKDGRVIREEEGHRLIPDVILHFPQNRDLIIDSKMSFTAFEEYYNAEKEEHKQDALKRHLNSVKNHVQELAKKDYSKYIPEGHERLDFVILYMFSEHALQLALSADPGLWKWAYDKKVIITGSQNLFPMLRVLEMSWNQVRQIENQHEIMETANMIIDRVQLFSERFEEVERKLQDTQKAFDEVKVTISQSGRSIPVAAAKLLKYGAQENHKRKKSLPKPEN